MSRPASLRIERALRVLYQQIHYLRGLAIPRADVAERVAREADELDEVAKWLAGEAKAQAQAEEDARRERRRQR